ncbi:MAG: hypothetical protein QOJ92_1948 [Frankiales bacterium]|nr:hypothetical protein [Frankiales bacterium]
MDARRIAPLLAALSVLLAAVAVMATAEAATVTAEGTASADAYVDGSYPASRTGTSSYLKVRNPSTLTSYLRIPVPAGAGGVTNASLRLYSTGPCGIGAAVGLVSGAWSEATLSWSNRPPIGASIGRLGSRTSAGWSILDVTSRIPSSGTFSIGVVATTSGACTYFAREHGAATAPRLVVTRTAGPTTPAPGSATPTSQVSTSASASATGTPTGSAAASPTGSPSATPTVDPTVAPTVTPTTDPTLTAQPTTDPTASPTLTAQPTTDPTASPTLTAQPTTDPTLSPTLDPTLGPTATADPTLGPTATADPTATLDPGPTPTPPVNADPVLAAAGDIACDPSDQNYNGGLGQGSFCQQAAVASLVAAMNPDAVLALGDMQYTEGTLAKFQTSYAPAWGRFDSIVRPVLGNHEYLDPGAAGYFDYFGAHDGLPNRAGNRGEGWYSFDLGQWHIIALNGECASVAGGCSAGSPQETWLKADLAAHPAGCTMAMWHRPRFTSGEAQVATTPQGTAAFWQDLYDADADVVLGGHIHNYERFAPVAPDGSTDAARGLREFVVGTGGKSLVGFNPTTWTSSEFRDSQHYGALRMVLHPTGYDWAFSPVGGGAAIDAGSQSCH